MRQRLPAFLTAALLAAAGSLGFALLDPSPAQAQCLSAGECDALRAQLRDFRDEVRALKQQLRRIHQELLSLPEESPERAALRRRSRELRRELRGLRRGEIRPLLERLRHGCRNC